MINTFDTIRDTLLVIEKDAHTAYLLDYMLSREGFNVVTSSNFETTYGMLDNMTPPKAVFLDVSFIREQACKYIHAIRDLPAWHKIPILLLAEQHNIDHVQSALDAGATDYIVQPFNAGELLFQIQRYS